MACHGDERVRERVEQRLRSRDMTCGTSSGVTALATRVQRVARRPGRAIEMAESCVRRVVRTGAPSLTPNRKDPSNRRRRFPPHTHTHTSSSSSSSRAPSSYVTACDTTVGITSTTPAATARRSRRRERRRMTEDDAAHAAACQRRPTVVTAVDRCDSCDAAVVVFRCTTDHRYAEQNPNRWGPAHES